MTVYIDYNAYINSDAWLTRRDIALEDAGHCCEFCGCDSPPLQAHHVTYANLGDEPWCDLIVLCRSCHMDVHEFPKRRAEVKAFAACRLGPREAAA